MIFPKKGRVFFDLTNLTTISTTIVKSLNYLKKILGNKKIKVLKIYFLKT